MAMAHFGGRRVVGVYPDLRSAERAITVLEAHGFDGDDLHLIGESVDQADSVDVSARDVAMTNKVAKSSILGATIGTLVGALVGLLVGALVGGQMWWVLGLIGGIALGAYGMAAGGYARLRTSDEWDLTFEPVAGEAAVAVRSADGTKLDEAADTMRDAGATRVELL